MDGISQVDYFFRLFEAVFERSDLCVSVPEDSDVSKILNGQRNVPKDIVFCLYGLASKICQNAFG